MHSGYLVGQEQPVAAVSAVDALAAPLADAAAVPLECGVSSPVWAGHGAHVKGSCAEGRKTHESAHGV